MNILFVLVLLANFGSTGTSLTRVGGYENYSQCVNAGKKAKADLERLSDLSFSEPVIRFTCLPANRM